MIALADDIANADLIAHERLNWRRHRPLCHQGDYLGLGGGAADTNVW
jgi:hypothetical protein